MPQEQKWEGGEWIRTIAFAALPERKKNIAKKNKAIWKSLQPIWFISYLFDSCRNLGRNAGNLSRYFSTSEELESYIFFLKLQENMHTYLHHLENMPEHKNHFTVAVKKSNERAIGSWKQKKRKRGN